METVVTTLPLCVAVITLGVLQRSGSQAGLLTLMTAIALTIILSSFSLSPSQLLLTLGVGLANALPVFYVIVPSLLLYRLLHSTGGMEVLGQGIARLVPDPSLQVLLLVIGLAPFAESVSGFGVGTILVIPVFMALGYSAAQASVLGILGQMAVPWGGLAIGTTLGAELTGLDPNHLGAYTALLTAPLPLLYGLLALFITGGKQAVRQRWPVALAAGSLLTGGVWGFSLFPGIELAGILAGAGVMGMLTIWSHRETSKRHPVRLIPAKEHPSLSLMQAIAPYVALTSLLLLSRLIPALKQWLQSHYVLTLPVLDLHLPVLYNPGFYLLLTVLITIPIVRLQQAEFQAAIAQVWQKFVPSAIAIICFLMTSQVMQASGMTATLGTTAATLGENYKWVAPWLAAFGGWMTGSNTGSNALFSPLQQEASLQSGLPLEWLMGAQNGASAHATMISPTRAILAATAVGWAKGETFLLRQLGPIVFAAVTVTTSLLALAVG